MQNSSILLHYMTIALLLQCVKATILINDSIAGKTNITTPVTYRCEFTSLWTATDHPNDFPSNHHWSPMVLVSHSNEYSMWSEGIDATNGVRLVAETGATSALRTEFDKAGDSISNVTISTPGFFPDNKSSTRKIDDITIDKDHSLLSSISMVAPSPDWFTGFYNVQPIQDDMWMESFTILTYPWDAGTDSGTSYTSPNQPTDPEVGIYQLVPGTLPSSNVFLSSDGTEVKPVARWECSIGTMVNPDSDDGTVNPDSDGNIKTLSLVSFAALFAIFFLL